MITVSLDMSESEFERVAVMLKLAEPIGNGPIPERHGCLFEVVKGRPYPRLPIGVNGPLVADGVKMLDLVHVAERFGRTERDWYEEWLAVFGEYSHMLAKHLLAKA